MKAKQLIEFLKERHPYPDDVFIPPTQKQWRDFHRALKKAGYESTGGFVGHCCRVGYDACLHLMGKYGD